VNRRTRLTLTLVGGAATCVALAFLGACSMSKMNEPFRDAPRGSTNSSPADVIEMPDGFSNLATKCDHGNRIYVAFHQDAPYGAIAVVPDQNCR